MSEDKQAYLNLLAQRPEDVDALYRLSMFYLEEGKLDEAQNFVEKSLQVAPNNFTLKLLLANIFKAQGLLLPAKKILIELIELRPDAVAFNNLGTIYFALQQFKEAIESYQHAIRIKADYIDAYYNLGLALNKVKNIQEAINAFQALIAISPDYLAAQFQLGCLFMNQFKYKEAIEFFKQIEEKQPYHFETITNLATCYLRLHQFHQAKSKYLQALDLVADDLQVLFNLGIISGHQGLNKEAIAYYLRVIKIQPDFFDAHNNLGIVYLNLKNKTAALLHFREAMKIQPNNKAIRHTINIMTGEGKLSSTPPEYVRSLFNAYADHYDAHLSLSLRYQVPKLMYEAMQPVTKDHRPWHLLDLGCGTGWCGEYFKPEANWLIGVDISADMLAVAAQKNIYDGLIEADIVPFLQDKFGCYDLILAADVLVYFGELDALFAKIKQALKQKSYFIFNTEINIDGDYVMTASGRFAHNKIYLDQLIVKYHFNMLSFQTVNLRTQDDVMVPGYLYVLGSGE